mgnify:FL=1
MDSRVVILGETMNWEGTSALSDRIVRTGFESLGSERLHIFEKTPTRFPLSWIPANPPRILVVTMSDVTQLLQQIESCEPSAPDQLLPVVYSELRKLAAARMRNEASDHTLQATALVHEAYIRLIGSPSGHQWDSRGHFFAAAAEAMRRILVDSARRKQRRRESTAQRRVTLEEVSLITDSRHYELLDLNEALDRFAEIDAETAELVKLRVFAGLTNEEAADLRNLPPSTAKKRWLFARAWLRREMGVSQHR